ncbi:MAG: patatin-like phospholipase family protein [Vicinamibacterales bacterium]
MTVRFDPSLGIAFEGCACRAAFHVGAIEWLREHGFRPAAVAGASSGSIVAAALAMGTVDDLRGAWMELVGRSVCDWRRLFHGRWPFMMTEIVSGAARRRFGDAVMADTQTPLGIPVTVWDRWRFQRRLFTARHPLRIAAVVQASCFLPGPYWQMVPLDGRPTFDGAWLARVPVDDVTVLGARKVIACSSNEEGRLLRGAVRVSDVATPAADHRVLYPIEPVALGAFDFDPGRSAQALAIGRGSAAAFVDRHRDWLTSRE